MQTFQIGTKKAKTFSKILFQHSKCKVDKAIWFSLLTFKQEEKYFQVVPKVQFARYLIDNSRTSGMEWRMELT